MDYFMLIQKEKLSALIRMGVPEINFCCSSFVCCTVSVMDGHSIMLEKWKNVQCDFGRKTPLGIIK